MSGDDLEDALIEAFDEMYRLWDAWAKDRNLIQSTDQNAAVLGDERGETVAALVFARGASTHGLIRFQTTRGFGTQPFGTSPFGKGGWYFKVHTTWPSWKQWQRERAQFYVDRVENRLVLDRLGSAYQWLRTEIPQPS